MLRLSCTNQNYDDNKDTIEFLERMINRFNSLFAHRNINITTTRGYSNTEITINLIKS